jgi:hypothetical protein
MVGMGNSILEKLNLARSDHGMEETARRDRLEQMIFDKKPWHEILETADFGQVGIGFSAQLMRLAIIELSRKVEGK